MNHALLECKRVRFRYSLNPMLCDPLRYTSRPSILRLLGACRPRISYSSCSHEGTTAIQSLQPFKPCIHQAISATKGHFGYRSHQDRYSDITGITATVVLQSTTWLPSYNYFYQLRRHQHYSVPPAPLLAVLARNVIVVWCW